MHKSVVFTGTSVRGGGDGGGWRVCDILSNFVAGSFVSSASIWEIPGFPRGFHKIVRYFEENMSFIKSFKTSYGKTWVRWS